MIKKAASPLPGHVRITFELPASMWADHIFLTGDFNNWADSDLPMRQSRDGIWRASLDLRAGRFYEFRYIVDGNWQTDYHADGFSSNRYGSHNSIVNASLTILESECKSDVPRTSLQKVPKSRGKLAQPLAVPKAPLPHFRPRTPVRSVA